jgi:hypothetical protein
MKRSEYDELKNLVSQFRVRTPGNGDYYVGIDQAYDVAADSLEDAINSFTIED